MFKWNGTKSGMKYLTAVVVSILVYLVMKYLSPVFSPFILAFLLAALINPLVQFLHRKIRIQKTILAGILLLGIGVLMLVLLWLLVCALVTGGGKLAVQIPDCQSELAFLLGNCCNMVEEKFGIDGVQIENFVLEQVDILIENMEVNILPEIMGKSVDYMKNLVSQVSFIVVMLIAVLLITKDYDELAAWLKGEDGLKGFREVGRKVILYVKTFVKAQLIILCIISTVCAAVLGVMGMEGGIFYGLLTGFMDMLPFIGTGIMLLPLAFFRLVKGSYLQAFLCVCLYGVCAVIREVLEPKLIGERIGIWPVGILFAVFAGIHLFGVWGIIKGPLALVIICEICKYLWKQQEMAGQEPDLQEE